jgi:hypothetical protein
MGGEHMSCPSCGVDAVGYRTCPGCGAPLASAQDFGPLHGVLLPARAWELTGPESYLLRYVGSAASERGAYKVALMELVARRVLRLDGVRMRRRVVPGTQTEWLLSDGPRIDGFAEPSLARSWRSTRACASAGPRPQSRSLSPSRSSKASV